MSVYAYTRVSTIEQIEGTSLADQAERITAQATALHLPTPAVVADAGVSGSIPLAERPGGSEMLDRAERGDTIIALKLDRMFRDASDALNVAKELKARGVDLILMDLSTEPVNGDGVGKVLFTMMAAFAELERTRIAERTRSGRVAKRASGGHIGGTTPFGYTKIGAGKDAKLVPNPQQQQAIETIKRGHAAGMALRQIADLVLTINNVHVSHVTVGKVIDRLAKESAQA